MNITLLSLINYYRTLLPSDSIEEIMRYYTYDEYEMAFEGFLIEVLIHKCPVNSQNLEEIVLLGKYSKLDIESVFDADIWSKFKKIYM